jgi:hypothetical protein
VLIDRGKPKVAAPEARVSDKVPFEFTVNAEYLLRLTNEKWD